MCINFVLLATGTAFDVTADKGSEPGPPKFSGDQLACLEETGMASRFMIMAAFKNGAAEGVVCGDVDMTLICKDARLDLLLQFVSFIMVPFSFPSYVALICSLVCSLTIGRIL